MTSPTATADSSALRPNGGYRHAAAFYAGRESFLAQTVPFLREGVALGEPALAVLPPAKIDVLRRGLGADAAGVEFADMDEVGANPARMIPAWRDFIAAHPGSRLRGVGEPIHPDRDPAELTECQHHERLLNPALAESSLYQLCPYDTRALPYDVIAEARRSHPILHDGALGRRCAEYDAADAAGGLFAEPLPELEGTPESIDVSIEALAVVRRFVMERAERAGLSETRAHGLVLGVNEVATNSLQHGGGDGVVDVWVQDDRVVCEVRDQGWIADPLVDRRRPEAGQVGGWGLWLANRVCDLIQLRSLATGTVARLHMKLP